ncbi:hypothetical protein ASPWEDRAFT_173902 [Aspergillus wentii DTO 134E9]|uniref:Translin-associated factor TraX n=1 Tax=Aspergillus wentii DTO 134E9 TaxID=1073089 RepID=A0A1L9RI08_ASPWE|nr:uncharacterized protein ASPWEDRAFT_173902 [Aspergillus wentii DTO 134E9]OJJ34487.1 hypothetical protein ASPWEDRAFT_173902 [Aspergillus wentii DTO 134E9]
MAGTKRSWEGKAVCDQNNNTQKSATMEGAGVDEPSVSTLSIFETFRDELDQHHDRRERVIKTSRDITAMSKKIIFSLQRVRTINTPIPPSIAKETKTRFDQILTLFRNVIPDVTGINSWRYQRQISGAIQEFIEALSFHHYLENQTLITLDEVRAHLPQGLLVTEEDYVMGLFDLTGEMMRFAITSLSAGGQAKDTDTDQAGGHNLPKLPSSQAGIVVDLRGMRSSFESLTVPRRHAMFKDMSKKVDVMQNSVEKVERAAYGILVRGSERPSGWMPDLSAPADVEIY